VSSLGAHFGRTSTAIMLADDDRRFRDVNAAACKLLGATHDELLAMRLDDIAAEDHREGVGELWAALLAEGTLDGSFAVVGPDGRRVEATCSAIANVASGLHLAALAPADGEVTTLGGGRERSAARGRGNGGAAVKLTPREREVVGLLAIGRTGEEIAEELVISPETVRIHVRNARRRLGARTRAQAIALALRAGQIQLTVAPGLFLN
jgi:PAS domain S-box-containing protein